MDYELGVWVLCQPRAGAWDFDADGGDTDDGADAADDDAGTFADVSTETFDGTQSQSQDELDSRPWWKGVVHT